MKRKNGFALASVLLAAILSAPPAGAAAGGAADFFAGRDPFTGSRTGLPEAVPAPGAAETLPAGVFDLPPDKIYYLLPSQVDLSLVRPAPAAGSETDREDLAAVRRWQAERTEAQCAAANAQDSATYDKFFGAVSPFASPTPAEVRKIFLKVRTDTGSVVFLLKRKYERPRPFLRDPALLPCLEKESGYSYPSGHSTAARVFGLMLSDLVPENARKYRAYADQAALNRVIGGVHHPSDVETGKVLGDAVYEALKQSGNFNADMAALRANLE